MSLLRSQGVGAGSRVGIALQVVLAAGLALAAVLLVNWLAARPGVRQRIDLTETGKNTLAVATLGTLAKLPTGAPVRIEILYEPVAGPLASVDSELMGRTQALLALLEDEADGRVEVEVADLSDPEAWRARSLTLRIEGFENGLLVSRGERRTFVPLIGRLAQVYLGDPARGIGPSVAAFTGEEAIIEALLDVTRGERLDAYFTFGFGELDVKDDEDVYQAGRLGSALEREGFRVHRWNPLEDGPLPANCEVLGILGPAQAWPESMRDEVEAYLDRGGRAVIAAPPDAEELRNSDLQELLSARGLQVSEGTLMVFQVESTTGKAFDGETRCNALSIPAQNLAQHPMMQPFRLARRGFGIISSHQVRVERQPEGGLAQVIAWAPNSPQTPVWLDAPPLDYRWDNAIETAFIAQGGVLATVEMPPLAPVATPLALEAELQTRLVVVGSTSAFMNGLGDNNVDLWRAAFNWVTDREHRVNVSPRDPDLRFLPRDRPGAATRAVQLAQYGLPLGALLIGCCVAFVRSRGGPPRRRDRAPEDAHAEAKP